MIYLLDTCILSLFARGDAGVQAKLKSMPPEQICVSVVTQMEVEYGLQLNPERAKRLGPVLDALMDSMQMLDYDSSAAMATARVCASLRTRGMPIGPFDALLAGTALARGLIMVTANIREFQRVPGLVVEDWS